MDMILINEDKLKIMMSREDLSAYGLCSEELDYSREDTRRMLGELLSEAELCLSFSHDGCRLLVQVYTSVDGGCEIFVSRLTALQSRDGEADLHYRAAYKDAEEYCTRGVFGFEELEWLLAVCRRLNEIGYTGGSSVFKGDNDRFYLMLDRLSSAEYSPVDEFTFICEYGEQENLSATVEYLSEHGKEICKHSAIERLAPL